MNVNVVLELMCPDQDRTRHCESLQNDNLTPNPMHVFIFHTMKVAVLFRGRVQFYVNCWNRFFCVFGNKEHY